MIKKRVLTTFVLILAFGIVLLLIKKLIFGDFITFSSFTVESPEEQKRLEEKAFSMQILQVTKLDSNILVVLELKEQSGKSQDITLIMSLLSEQQQKISTKEEQVILEEYSTKQYSFILPDKGITKNAVLTIGAWNGKQLVEKQQQIIIPRTLMTGYAISNFAKRNMPGLIMFLIALVLVTLTLRFIMNHHKRTAEHHKLGQRIHRHTIRLDLD